MSQPDIVPSAASPLLNAEPAPVEPSAPKPWSLPARLGFRFLFACFVLVILPFPFQTIPGLGWMGSLIGAALDKPFDWTLRLSAWLVHYPGPLDAPMNGSGDRAVDWLHQLSTLMLAAGVALVWSAIDRRPRSHRKLHAALHGYARYYLASVLFSYGLEKVFVLQMPAPWPERLEERIGDASPMGLLWTLIGSSTPYERFAGLTEVVGAVLLLWRRTALLGALVLVGVMTNVVMYNFCFDVPVKIFSSTLLLMALFLCAQDVPRLLAVATGRAAPASVPSPVFPLSWSRVVLALEVVAGLMVIGCQGWSMREELAERPRPPAGTLPFEGRWRVERQVVDGREVPPLLTEDHRWETVRLTNYARGVGLTARRVDEKSDGWWGKLDEATHTLQFRSREGPPPPPLTYAFPDEDHMVLMDASQKWSFTLRKLPPDQFLLTHRGFHWVSEEPFNR